VRIACDAGPGLRSAAFYTAGKTAAVIANPGAETALRVGDNAEAYVTDETRDLAPVRPENGVLTLPAKSVATVVLTDGGEENAC
jgi:hypothetical protein